MLKLLFAAPSAGLTDKFIENIAGEAAYDMPTILLVPRHLSHECERRLCLLCGDSASLKAEVLTTHRLANRVFSDIGGVSDEYLDDAGRLLVLRAAARKVEGSLSVLAPHLKKPEYVREVVRFIDEMKSCWVDIKSLEAAADEIGGELGTRVRDIAIIYAAYDAELGQRGDPRDMYQRLAAALDEGWAKNRRVAVIGFTDFTAQEYEIMRILIRDCAEVAVGFIGSDAHNYAEKRGDDDPFYAQHRSAEDLKRLAAQAGVMVRTEFIQSDGSRPTDLRFLEENLYRDPQARLDDVSNAVEIYSEISIWSECERAAAEIISLVRTGNMMYRDIAVAVPDEGDYRGTIDAVFSAWDIPIFMDSTDDISKKPVVASLYNIVDIILNGFEPTDVLSYLKAGFSPLGFNAACRVESYVKTWNIRGRQWTSGNDWTLNPDGFTTSEREEDRERVSRELRWLNDARRTLSEPFLRFSERVSRGREYPADTLLREFYELLTALRFDRNIARRGAEFKERGDLKTSGEYSQLWDIICEMLDDAYSILQQTPMTFAEFASYLKILMTGKQVGTIPVALDGVPVGDAGRLRHRQVKCLFILGASAGAFPPPVPQGALFGDGERERLSDCGLNIQPSSELLSHRSAETAYAAITLPSEKLVMSWVGTSGTPGFLLGRIASMLGLSIGKPSGDERLLAAKTPAFELALRAADGTRGGKLAAEAFSYFSALPEYRERIEVAIAAEKAERGSLSKESVELLYGEKPTLTASRIDTFKGCAFGYFMRYGLYAKPQGKASLDSLESGSLLHRVLEQTVQAASERGLLRKDIGEQEKRAARELAYGFLRGYAEETLGGLDDKGARTAHLFERLKQAVGRITDNVMDEFAVSDFRPTDFELSFGRKEGDLQPVDISGSAELHGKVDRVDMWSNGDGQRFVRVIDYKSGSTKFDLSDVYHGTRIQLLIYLHALVKHGGDKYDSALGAGVLYTPARDEISSGTRGISDADALGLREKALKRSGIVLDEAAVIDAMERGTPKRFLPVGFKKDGTLSAVSSVADRERFEHLDKHVMKILKETANEISDGTMSAVPSYGRYGLTCGICKFREACRYDDTGGHDKFKYNRRIDKEEFWNLVGGENA